MQVCYTIQIRYVIRSKLVVLVCILSLNISLLLVGDNAVSDGLDAFEKAIQLNGRRDSRHNIGKLFTYFSNNTTKLLISYV